MCLQWKENLGGPLLKKQKQKQKKLFKSEEYGIDENRDLKYIYLQTTNEILIKQWRKNIRIETKKKYSWAASTLSSIVMKFTE